MSECIYQKFFKRSTLTVLGAALVFMLICIVINFYYDWLSLWKKDKNVIWSLLIILFYLYPFLYSSVKQILKKKKEFSENQRIIAENAQFTGIAAGQGVGFTTGLLHLRKGLGMRETPIRPHSWHCRMQSDYQYDGNRKRPPVWRRHRGSLRPRGRNLGRVEGMTGSCGSGCDPAIHARRLRVYHRPRRLRMASRISIFFAARRFEPLNSMG